MVAVRISKNSLAVVVSTDTVSCPHLKGLRCEPKRCQEHFPLRHVHHSCRAVLDRKKEAASKRIEVHERDRENTIDAHCFKVINLERCQLPSGYILEVPGIISLDLKSKHRGLDVRIVEFKVPLAGAHRLNVTNLVQIEEASEEVSRLPPFCNSLSVFGHYVFYLVAKAPANWHPAAIALRKEPSVPDSNLVALVPIESNHLSVDQQPVSKSACHPRMVDWPARH